MYYYSRIYLTAENSPARLEETKLATKLGIDDLVEKRDFDDKLKKYKQVTSNKIKHVETENKLIDLRNKVAQVSEKGMIFCWTEFIFKVALVIRIF